MKEAIIKPANTTRRRKDVSDNSWERWLDNPSVSNSKKAGVLVRMMARHKGERVRLSNEVANLKKRLYRLQNPGWHTSKRWHSPNYTYSGLHNALVLEHKRYTGDNEWRYVTILKPGVKPITYYRRLRQESHQYQMMKAGWEDREFFTPYTARSHKSRRNGQEVWIITFDIRRDC